MRKLKYKDQEGQMRRVMNSSRIIFTVFGAGTFCIIRYTSPLPINLQSRELWAAVVFALVLGSTMSAVYRVFHGLKIKCNIIVMVISFAFIAALEWLASPMS